MSTLVSKHDPYFDHHHPTSQYMWLASHNAPPFSGYFVPFVSLPHHYKPPTDQRGWENTTFFEIAYIGASAVSRLLPTITGPPTWPAAFRIVSFRFTGDACTPPALGPGPSRAFTRLDLLASYELLRQTARRRCVIAEQYAEQLQAGPGDPEESGLSAVNEWASQLLDRLLLLRAWFRQLLFFERDTRDPSPLFLQGRNFPYGDTIPKQGDVAAVLESTLDLSIFGPPHGDAAPWIARAVQLFHAHWKDDPYPHPTLDWGLRLEKTYKDWDFYLRIIQYDKQSRPRAPPSVDETIGARGWPDWDREVEPEGVRSPWEVAQMGIEQEKLRERNALDPSATIAGLRCLAEASDPL